MILTRTPTRISFFGGGSDYCQWWKDHDGAVLATAINKFCYVAIRDGKTATFYDVPTKAGLAISSAYTAGLLRACTNVDNLAISKMAQALEFEKMGGNIGYQDQIICAMGGFHHLRFSAQGIRDRLLDPELVNPLQDYLMLFDTHQYRRAGDVVAHQLAEMDKHEDLLTKMAAQVDYGIEYLKTKDYLSFGILLDDAWKMKKQLSPNVTTPTIDAIYDASMKAGATGGKLLGAGGGGFIAFFVEPDKQEAVKVALDELTHVPFRFETEGTKVLYRD